MGKIKVESNIVELDKKQTKELIEWLKTVPWLKDKLVLYITLGDQKICVKNIGTI